jgi:tRNA(Arg) A34 adenosine deaminase TadA
MHNAKISNQNSPEKHPMRLTQLPPGATSDDPADIDATDSLYLRQAIAWSCVARARGNRPFGAVVVSQDGKLLTEAYCNTTETGDCTGHAETNAVRQLTPFIGRDVLAHATLYSSGEPCVMCAGAIFWSGIGRVVFGIDAVSLRVFRGERSEQRDAEMSCRDVFAASPHPIECIGPALLQESSAPHIGFWKT